LHPYPVDGRGTGRRAVHRVDFVRPVYLVAFWQPSSMDPSTL
jgi:hypothetical protein